MPSRPPVTFIAKLEGADTLATLIDVMTSVLRKWSLAGVLCTLLFALPVAHGDETPKRLSVPEKFAAKVEALFQKYYPNAKFTTEGSSSLHVEFEVARFEFPPAKTKGKRESRVQSGPKEGGILCSVYSARGTYVGQLALVPLGGGHFAPTVIDEEAFKQLLAAPYSPKSDIHLWVSLCYPSDASDDFLKEFRQLLDEFEKDPD